MIFSEILASGKGNRFGSDLPKQFLKLHQKEILIKSIDAFFENEKIDRIIVVVSEQYLGYTQQLIDKYYPNNNKIDLVIGGLSRADSLMAGIYYIKERYHSNNQDIVLTHDAVRCFVSQEIIDNNIKALENCDCVTTAIKCIDTVFAAQDKHVTACLDRDKLYNIQTPQSFKINKLVSFYERLSSKEKQSLTDGCGIFLLNNQEVRIVEGSDYNIKITTPYHYQQAMLIENLVEKE